MLVEFIGAAGIGKTFLSDRLVTTLREKDLPVRNFDLIRIQRIAPRNILLALQAVYLAFLTQPSNFAHFLYAAKVIARYSIRRTLCSQIGGISIASEGLFHQIITLHRNSDTLELVEMADILCSKIRPPEVVIIIEANVDKVLARRTMRNRPNDEFSRDSIKADIAIVREAGSVIDKVKHDKSAPYKVLRVRADDDGGEANIALIIAAIKELVANHGDRPAIELAKK